MAKMEDGLQQGHASGGDEWARVLSAGVRAQQLVPGSIAVGGTASALYAEHRISYDTDHLLASLETHFDGVLEALSEQPEWKTTRVRRPVLILGSIDDVQVGFRQMRRSEPIETVKRSTPYGPLVVPTLDEMIGMKAYLAYSRNTVRDFLDFAALSRCANEVEVLASLLKTDRRYGALQTASAGLEVAKALSEPKPYDLDSTDLSAYKGLSSGWHDWERVKGIAQHFGVLLGRELVGGSGR